MKYCHESSDWVAVCSTKQFLFLSLLSLFDFFNDVLSLHVVLCEARERERERELKSDCNAIIVNFFFRIHVHVLVDISLVYRQMPYDPNVANSHLNF